MMAKKVEIDGEPYVNINDLFGTIGKNIGNSWNGNDAISVSEAKEVEAVMKVLFWFDDLNAMNSARKSFILSYNKARKFEDKG